MTLDGFIAGAKGEYDWIVADPSIDFAALYKEFDTAVMGRKTYEVGLASGGDMSMPGIEAIVFSRTLPPSQSPGFRVVADDPREVVRKLKSKPGRDIWLFGGGELFRYLLDGGLVDTVEVAVMPVLLGAGIPLLPAGRQTNLVLSDVKRLPSGIIALAYTVEGSKGSAPEIRYINPKRAQRKRARSSSAPKRTGASRKGVSHKGVSHKGARRR